MILSIFPTISGSGGIPPAEASGFEPLFSGGDGTAGNPYKITNVTELQWMGNTSNLDKHFVLLNDIYASSTKTWNSGAGFVPVGTDTNRFTGSLDGKGYNITGLFINRSDIGDIGLFGYVESGGVVKNINLIDHNVIGSGYSFGGLVGANSGTISNCCATGNVNSNFNVGGLVGANSGTISNCYATGNVYGTNTVGGLAGSNTYGSLVNCYATGNVYGTYAIGGLMGYNVGTVNKCYATGNVTGTEHYIGGLIGYNLGMVSNSHYNVQKVFVNGEYHLTFGGLYDDQYQDWFSNNMSLNIEDYSSTLVPSGDYYTISTVQGLRDLLGFADVISYKFCLTADIDLSTAEGLYIPYFSASEFDGNKHIISNLSIQMNFTAFVGMFGYVASSVKVHDIGIIDALVVGYENVGGLVGYNAGGTVSKSFSTGNVSGSIRVGGLVGANDLGTVSSCYTTETVSGIYHIGGFVGSNYGTVSNCYATGNVIRSSGTSTSLGGFVGYNYRNKIINCYSTGRVIYKGSTDPIDRGFAGMVDDASGYEMFGNFWDTQTSGQMTTEGKAMGRNTKGMMSIKIFKDVRWDIVHVRDHVNEVWYVDEGYDYPRLGWESYRDIHPPVAVTGPDKTVNMGVTVLFNGSLSTDNIRIVSYTWTFTDGVIINLSGILQSHRFDNAGVFLVTLNVTDPAGNWDTDTMIVTVLDTQSPIANAGPDRIINMGETVLFNASLSADNVGIERYIWTFTDDVPIILSGINPSYQFDNAGVFIVTLNVTDFAGNRATDSMKVTVNDIAVPIADAGSDIMVDEGTTVTFDGTLSTDNIRIVNYTWTLMDGKSITLYGPTSEYIFNNPGVFIVSLNVTDASGNWAITTITVTVRDITSPIANAGIDQRIAVGTTVILNGSLSTDNIGIVRYTWTFTYDGVERTLEGSQVQFKFEKAGTYKIKLIVFDEYENSGDDSVIITVIDTGIVKGTVLYKDRNPVEGAIVGIKASNGQTYSMTTGSNGSFIIEIFYGNFTWTLTKEGYETINGTASVDAIGEIILALTMHPVDKIIDPIDTGGDKGPSIVLFIVIAVILILIIIGIVIFLLTRKKKEPEEDKEGMEDITVEDKEM